MSLTRHPIAYGLLLAACLFPVLGCAAFRREPAPAPAAPPAPVAAPAAPAPPPPPPAPAVPVSRLLCTVQEARKVSFADLGVPAGSRPVDLALGKRTVWVLFAPSLLVAVPREGAAAEPAAIAEFGEVEETEMIPGPRPDAWQRLSIDWDGTLWLSSPSGLWRRRPGSRPEPVPVTVLPAEKPQPRGKRSKGRTPPPPLTPAGPPVPANQGGFRAVQPGRGAVWAAPACSPQSLWKLDTRGRLLGTALPQEPCAAADLLRDWSGDVWAVLSRAGAASPEALRLAFDGSWQPAAGALALPLPAEGTVHSWFFWGTEPLGLGGPAGEPLLYRRVNGTVTAFHEDCGPGNALVRTDGDARGWAVLSRQWLLLGEHKQPAAAGSH